MSTVLIKNDLWLLYAILRSRAPRNTLFADNWKLNEHFLFDFTTIDWPIISPVATSEHSKKVISLTTCGRFFLLNKTKVFLSKGGCWWLIVGLRCAGRSGAGLAWTLAEEISGKLAGSDSNFVIEGRSSGWFWRWYVGVILDTHHQW